MWIVIHSKEMMDNFKSRSFSETNSIITSYFSTLYTTILHVKLKTSSKNLSWQSFSIWNKSSICYQFNTLEYHMANLVNSEQKGKTQRNISMLEFLIDNIYENYSGRLFSKYCRHSFGNELCTSPCRPLLFFIRVWVPSDNC